MKLLLAIELDYGSHFERRRLRERSTAAHCDDNKAATGNERTATDELQANLAA